MRRSEKVAMGVVPHGTTSTYSNYLCRCGACRAAWASYCADRRAFIRENGALVPGWRDLLRGSNREQR